jgi:Ca2+-binding EF-hand superfamily protein
MFHKHRDEDPHLERLFLQHILPDIGYPTLNEETSMSTDHVPYDENEGLNFQDEHLCSKVLKRMAHIQPQMVVEAVQNESSEAFTALVASIRPSVFNEALRSRPSMLSDVLEEADTTALGSALTVQMLGEIMRGDPEKLVGVITDSPELVNELLARAPSLLEGKDPAALAVALPTDTLVEMFSSDTLQPSMLSDILGSVPHLFERLDPAILGVALSKLDHAALAAALSAIDSVVLAAALSHMDPGMLAKLLAAMNPAALAAAMTPELLKHILDANPCLFLELVKNWSGWLNSLMKEHPDLLHGVDASVLAAALSPEVLAQILALLGHEAHGKILLQIVEKSPQYFSDLLKATPQLLGGLDPVVLAALLSPELLAKLLAAIDPAALSTAMSSDVLAKLLEAVDPAVLAAAMSPEMLQQLQNGNVCERGGSSNSAAAGGSPADTSLQSEGGVSASGGGAGVAVTADTTGADGAAAGVAGVAGAAVGAAGDGCVCGGSGNAAEVSKAMNTNADFAFAVLDGLSPDLLESYLQQNGIRVGLNPHPASLPLDSSSTVDPSLTSFTGLNGAADGMDGHSAPGSSSGHRPGTARQHKWLSYAKKLACKKGVSASPLRFLRHQIFDIYKTKIEAALSDDGAAVQDMPQYVIEWLLVQFGEKKIVVEKLRLLHKSVKEHMRSDEAVKLFARFCQIGVGGVKEGGDAVDSGASSSGGLDTETLSRSLEVLRSVIFGNKAMAFRKVDDTHRHHIIEVGGPSLVTATVSMVAAEKLLIKYLAPLKNIDPEPFMMRLQAEGFDLHGPKGGGHGHPATAAGSNGAHVAVHTAHGHWDKAHAQANEKSSNGHNIPSKNGVVGGFGGAAMSAVSAGRRMTHRHAKKRKDQREVDCEVPFELYTEAATQQDQADQTMLMAAFERVDSDGSGEISYKEFCVMLQSQRCTKHLVPSEIARIYAGCTAGSDTHVMDLHTFSTEVMKRLKKISSLDIMQEMTHIAHPITWESLISVNVKPIFDKFDPDKSGFLDEEELGAMLMEVDNSETKQTGTCRLASRAAEHCFPIVALLSHYFPRRAPLPLLHCSHITSHVALLSQPLTL